MNILHIYPSAVQQVQPQQLSSKLARRTRNKGFTLTELIVTIAIFAVIVGLAVPGMQTLITSNRVSNFANEFNAALIYTRSEALNRNMCVVMCIAADTNAPDPVCSPDLTDWNNGWIIFANPTNAAGTTGCDTGSNPAVLPVGSELLQVYAGDKNGPKLSSNGNNAIQRIMFTARGTLPFVAAARSFTMNTGSNGTPANSPVKTLTLDVAGRLTICKYNGSTC